MKSSRNITLKLLAATVLAMPLAACKHGEPGAQVAGWTLVDATQRHPILVSQQPSSMSVRVARGSNGLSPSQRAEVLDFASRFRASDNGNSRLVIAAPGGAPNEVAAMHAVQEIRHLLSDNGFAESAIAVEAYHEDRDPSPPIRVSYLRYVAQAPECGNFGSNLAYEPQNLPYANFGCATQKNFANMVSNPADLLGPRSETPRSGERRDQAWDKYLKGEVTGAKKAEDEKIQTRNTN